MSTNNGGSSQLWDVKSINVPNYPDSYYFVNVATGKFLTNDASTITTSPFNRNSKFQQWQKIGNSYKNIGSGQYLIGTNGILSSNAVGEDWELSKN